MDDYLLSIIIFLPIVGAILIALFGRSTQTIKGIAALFTAASFVMALSMFIGFDRSAGAEAYQFTQQFDWIPAINAEYYLGVDGLSAPLVLLTAFLGFLSVFISWNIKDRVREYFAWLLVLEASILGVFCSLDFLLFFLFWELELIPMYMLISIWGTKPPLGRREYSAIKYVAYTFIGSAFMLSGILLLYFKSGDALGANTFNMVDLADKSGLLFGAVSILPVIFFFIFIGFAVKLPMFPLHTWLPDAHTDAPTAASVMLAGVLIKMGGYGMIRCVGIFPGVAKDYAWILVLLAVIGVLYGAAVTLRQIDLKRLIAYSSVSHMGYVLLGIFALGDVSMTGAALQMLSHGVVTGLLFAMVGLVYDKTHERRIPLLGGLARQMPVIAVVFSIAGLASLGLPSTSGFAAEFMTFIGSFNSDKVSYIQLYTILGIAGIVVTAGYILWMLERVFYREPKGEWDGTPDASPLEMATVFSLVLVILLIGIYPRLFTDIMTVPIQIIVGKL
ncbi:NuoM family protein [Chloroflexota bacterium]